MYYNLCLLLKKNIIELLNFYFSDRAVKLARFQGHELCNKSSWFFGIGFPILKKHEEQDKKVLTNKTND